MPRARPSRVIRRRNSFPVISRPRRFLLSDHKRSSRMQLDRPTTDPARQRGVQGWAAQIRLVFRWGRFVMVEYARIPNATAVAKTNTTQYRALPGVRGKGMASRTLARPVT